MNLQDLLSEKFCGEGVPLWAALPEGKQFPIPVEDQPYRVDVNDVPSQADCDRHNWPEYHGTYATSTGFQSLYDNKEGVQEALAKYWITVAQRFGHYENVLGYNLINEPWAGDVFKVPIFTAS